MRIIGGIHKGRTLKVPRDLPVRPTTDFAKEGLFNILSNRLDFEDLNVLDLFSGTGHISLEFGSRGSSRITSVDSNYKCIHFLRTTGDLLHIPLSATKADVFEYLKSCTSEFDLIFADPPYDLENIPEIHRLVFDRGLLKEGGMLIIEHGPRTKLGELSHFTQHRKYGNVNFSFFTFPGKE